MAGDFSSKKWLGAFGALVLVIGVVSFVTFSRLRGAEHPPTLSADSRLQGLIQAGEYGFAQWEELDIEEFNTRKADFIAEGVDPLTVVQGVNYLHADENLTFQEAFYRVDPAAEEAVIASYSAVEGKFLIYPKTTYYEQDATVLVDPDTEEIPAGTGYFLITTNASEGFGFKTGEDNSAVGESALCDSPNGWNLVAAGSSDLIDLLDPCFEDIKIVFVQDGPTNFSKVYKRGTDERADIEDYQLEEYFLVWGKIDRIEEEVACKEPQETLGDLLRALGNKDFVQAFRELPPAYQAQAQDELVPLIDEIFTIGNAHELMTDTARVFDTLHLAVNDDEHYKQIYFMLPSSWRDFIDADPDFKEAVLETFEFGVDASEWLAHLGLTVPHQAEEILAGLGEVLEIAEVKLEKISDSFEYINQYYEPLFTKLALLKTAETELSEMRGDDLAVVTTKFFPEGGAPQEQDINLERVAGTDCDYWILENASEGFDLYRTTLERYRGIVAGHEDFGEALAEAVKEIGDTVVDFDADNLACPAFYGVYAQTIALNNARGDEFDDLLLNPLVEVEASSGVATPISVADGDTLATGPVNGTVVGAVYTSNDDYVGEDWLLYSGSTDDPEPIASATMQCINITE